MKKRKHSLTAEPSSNNTHRQKNTQQQQSKRQKDLSLSFLYHPRSKLIQAEFEKLFNPSVWKSHFTPHERSYLMTHYLLPIDYKDAKSLSSNTTQETQENKTDNRNIQKEDESRDNILNPLFLSNSTHNIFMRDNWSSFREHLAMGAYIPEIMDSKLISLKPDADDFDIWKENEFENVWGHLLDKSIERKKAEESQSMGLKELIMAKRIKKNDILSFKAQTSKDSIVQQIKILSVNGAGEFTCSIINPKNSKNKKSFKLAESKKLYSIQDLHKFITDHTLDSISDNQEFDLWDFFSLHNSKQEISLLQLKQEFFETTMKNQLKDSS